jgi:hypothetical protein
MKISEFAVDKQVDEINAAGVGAAAGKATRAVGSGIKNFAKGFASGVTGKADPATASSKANPTIDPIKASIAKLNPKQQAALRKQLAKKAGVA